MNPQPGTVTALVGPSGAGKSTIIGLIAAFYVPSAGRVLVDGVDLAHVRLDSYRTQLGVVLQETFLFDGTIRENVAFARPDASEEEILAACRIARVDEFADNFEKKYETIVGERGVKLSGGQKQRVSIARAILADPRILILDEATSSLDSESEALIQEGLRFLMRGRTTFVIAHRLSTIRRADQILVVEGWENHRKRHARIALRPAKAATTISTPDSMASRRISFWRPAKATRSRKIPWRKRRIRIGQNRRRGTARRHPHDSRAAHLKSAARVTAQAYRNSRERARQKWPKYHAPVAGDMEFTDGLPADRSAVGQ